LIIDGGSNIRAKLTSIYTSLELEKRENKNQ
jgi:hypothetical protein